MFHIYLDFCVVVFESIQPQSQTFLLLQLHLQDLGDEKSGRLAGG